MTQPQSTETRYWVLHTQVGEWNQGAHVTAEQLVGSAPGVDDRIQRLLDLGAIVVDDGSGFPAEDARLRGLPNAYNGDNNRLGHANERSVQPER